MKYDLIAPCYFGTESAAAFDFKRIGAEDVAVTDGRVAFRGEPDIIAAANLWSRCAERVLILLKTYRPLPLTSCLTAYRPFLGRAAARGRGMAKGGDVQPAPATYSRHVGPWRATSVAPVQRMPAPEDDALYNRFPSAKYGGEYAGYLGDSLQARLPQKQYGGAHQGDAGRGHH